MSQTDSANYGLRPRRSAKGKYREMMGIAEKDVVQETEPEEELKTEKKPHRKVYLLPIVVSGSTEVVASNALEIEISDPTGVPTEKPAAASAAAGDSTATSDALLRIEEILFRNEQLVESLKDTRPVAPKRGRVDAKLGGKDAGSGSKRSASTEDEDVEDPLRLTIQPIDGQRAATQDEPATSESAERPSSKAKPAPALEATAEDGGGGGGGSSSELCVCDICGKTLKHQKSLYSHRRTHTDSKAVCHICGATLKSARYLHHHLLLHKNVEKPHKCDKCGKAFFSSSALKVHHYYNHEETAGRFQCTICSKSFKAKQGLQFHMDSHSSELRYECSYCHKRFRGFKTCRVHELRHKEANQPGKFSCQICSKRFMTRQTLKNHEDVHAAFNRYQCSLCEKRFKLRKSCLAHIRVHHNDSSASSSQQVATSTSTGEASANGVVVDNDVDDGQEGDGDDHNQTAVQSLLDVASGEEYVVTLEEGVDDVEAVLHLASQQQQHHHHHPHQNQQEEQQQPQTIELVVPEADVECEVNYS